MKYVDPHIHMVSRVTDDYKRMALAGCVLVSEPAFWAGFRSVGRGGFSRLLPPVDRIRGQAGGPVRDRALLLAVHQCQGGRERLAFARSDRDDPRVPAPPGVLGIGEIGLNKNTRNEATVFLDHLDLAARTQELVLVHTPHLADKYQGTRMILDMLRDDQRIHPERVCIDHVEEHTIRDALECRALGGDDALSDHQVHAGAGGRFDRDLWDRADHGQFGRRLGAQRSAGRAGVDLRDAARGHDDALIRKVVHENPLAFFSQCARFDYFPSGAVEAAEST